MSFCRQAVADLARYRFEREYEEFVGITEVLFSACA
jgi:hypothetical protein